MYRWTDLQNEAIKLLDTVNNDTINFPFLTLYPSSITTIAGSSSSGKSTLLSQIRAIISEDKSFDIFSLELEMLPSYQMLRWISYHYKVSMNSLLKGEHKDLISSLNKDNVFMSGWIKGIASLKKDIHEFLSQSSKDKILITIDHALLVNPSREKEGIDELMGFLLELKKLSSKKLYIVVVAQLNRDIESVERLSSPYTHFPKPSDIHGSSQIFMSSDVVAVIHTPYKVLSSLGFYSHKNLPLTKDGLPLSYIHILKDRFSLPKVFCLKADFEYSTFHFEHEVLD